MFGIEDFLSGLAPCGSFSVPSTAGTDIVVRGEEALGTYAEPLVVLAFWIDVVVLVKLPLLHWEVGARERRAERNHQTW